MLCTKKSHPFQEGNKVKITTRLVMIACAIILAATGLFGISAALNSHSTGAQPEQVSNEAQACTSQTPVLVNGMPENGHYYWDEVEKTCLYLPPGYPPAPLP